MISPLDENQPQKPSLKECLLTVLDRIKRTKGNELPSSTFSEALNAVGERFVDHLLAKPRTGRWWLGPDWLWHVCTIQRLGKQREARVFLPASHPSWEAWFPKHITRLADGLTGPDHVLSVQIPSLGKSEAIVLEQKLRLSNPQDAIATASTYCKHLRAKMPKRGLSHYPTVGDYCNALLEDIKAFLPPAVKAGIVSYSGKVPHVVYASIVIEPHLIHVTDSGAKGGHITCSAAGFLAPIINRKHFTSTNPHVQVARHSAVNLWLGLDDLLQQCSAEEVDEAWAEMLRWLTASVRDPQWRTDVQATEQGD